MINNETRSLEQGITVLSLCDGMSCGHIALDRIGIKVNKYFASEIKTSAIYVTQLNFPDTIQIGDVNEFDPFMLRGEKVDLLLCGSPCQDMSLINISNRTNINGSKSKLFYKCVEILQIVKPKYFIFENVASMKNKDKEIITNCLGVEPILINSSLVSAQERRRYYWTNIENVQQPKDKGILLSDILEKNPICEENWSKNKTDFVKRKVNSTMYVRVNGDKSLPITRRGYASWNTQFVSYQGGYRDLTIKEYKRLQTIPDEYSFGKLIKSKVTDLIGDGWTVDVIAHILSYLK